MASSLHDTTAVAAPAAADRRPTGAIAPDPPPAEKRPRPVENITRVTVAFPFSTIQAVEPEVTHLVHQLTELVAALATALDAERANPATAELADRARTLVQNGGDR